MLQQNLRIEEYVKDSDEEIGGLHQYVSLMDNSDRNEQAAWLNILAALFLPVPIVTGLWGMNKNRQTYWKTITICVAKLFP